MGKPISYTDQKAAHPKTFLSFDEHPDVRGLDCENAIDIDALLSSYATTGFQATHLSMAIHIIERMIKEDAAIYLTFTSNIISSGLRDIITYLVKHKRVAALFTTAGGIEEDIIKCLKPFKIGDFSINGRYLFDNGVCRTGNLLVPNDRYLYFEEFMNGVFERLHSKHKVIGAHELIEEMGNSSDDKSSYLYWAAKNKIPVFCPAPTDGALGDMIFFAKQRYPDLVIDVAGDMKKIVDMTLNQEKTGGIMLGGGAAKHFALNANIFRDGFDSAVYINTAQEFDGSDSGATPDEAVTWAKIKPNAPRVKVHADATIVFPLIVAATFARR